MSLKSITEQFVQQKLSVHHIAMIEITNDEQCGLLQLDDGNDKANMNFIENHDVLRVINSRRTRSKDKT